VALAGGGTLGAVYEVGALAALAEAVPALDLNDARIYVGVSAGSVIAAALANGFTPHRLVRLFVEGEDGGERFDPGLFLTPALTEYAGRLRRLPPLLLRALRVGLDDPRTLPGCLEPLGHAIPTGLFSGEPVAAYLAQLFSRPGRSNDFRTLQRRLYVVATDLDTGEAVVFGRRPTAHVPISRAVQASSALPGLYPPVVVDGRSLVDGALRKTLHASLALEAGVDLLICVNPLVPYDARRAAAASPQALRPRRLSDGGLPTVLAQTFRSLIESRLEAGMAHYRRTYPQTTLLRLEPDRSDAAMFFNNPFSYADRSRLCEHAYQTTRRALWMRRRSLARQLAAHGLALHATALREPRRLVRPVRAMQPWLRPALATGLRRLESCLDDLGRAIERLPLAPR
jgi:predicted acylesterase/phospholipase RssA